ncbi:MAG TPA: MnhB domain-containing protein, partial [Rhodothermales bacterium]|nr:MnhB domain-containing protein [Rhodothermales bacterium]
SLYLLFSGHNEPGGGFAGGLVALPSPGDARLAVLDLLGREVALLTEGLLAAGTHTATWNAAGVPPGVYVARLTGSGQTRSRLLVVQR